MKRLTSWLQASVTRAWRESDLPSRVAGLSAFVIALAMLTRALGGLARHLELVGDHDWDSHLVYRELTMASLREGEMPLWAPHLCGGNPLWGYAEGATNLVSPYLPAYLLLPISVAIRVEVAGAALTMALGCFLLAGRFTRRISLRVLVVALGAVNGRWALQVAAGHSWHLQYCWLPFALYFFDRALERRRFGDVCATGAAIALIAYTGGVYPLPHTVLALGVYAVVLAVSARSLRPLATLATVGLVSLGLSAPKLLPVLQVMQSSPRLIESSEAFTFSQLVTALTARWDRLGPDTPLPFEPIWWWHEYGIYVGWAGALVMALGIALPGDRRLVAIKLTGLSFLVLGCGAFHRFAPWTLLHLVPPFSSQHVPSRFLYTAVLLLAVSCVGSIDALWQRRLQGRARWLDAALLAPVALIFFDVTRSAATLIPLAFTRPLPTLVRSASFHHVTATPTKIEFGIPAPMIMLPTVRANEGILTCYGIPPVSHAGARAVDGEGYRGEAYVDERGDARIVAWTTQHAVVEYQNAAPGAHVVYNMNFLEGWRADGEPAVPWNDAVSTRATGPSGRIVFRYRPSTFVPGVAIGIATVVILTGLLVRRKRRSGCAPSQRESS